MNRTTGWIVTIVAIIVIIALVLLIPKLGDDAPETTDKSQTSNGQGPVQDEIQLVLGQADAGKTIIEYGDYKCPNCARFHTSSYVELKREYLDTGKAKIVFRNLPYIAEDSRVAAEGSYCANEQDLFEQYHGGVYDHTSEIYAKEGIERESDNILTTELLSDILADAGGDKQQFIDCLDNKNYEAEVDNDLNQAKEDGARGTPTFLINGQKIVGAQPITVFRTLLEDN